MNSIQKIIAIGLLSLSMNVSAAIITNAGQITGITGVNVNGALYDVTLNNILTADMISSLPFGTFNLPAWDFARAASVALDTLFDGVYQGENFDYFPNLSLGCEALSNCNWFTPVGLLGDAGRGVTFTNTPDFGSASDFYSIALGTYSDRDLNTDYANTTFLSWAESQPIPVPIPGTLALMSIGLAGIGLTRKRKSVKL